MSRVTRIRVQTMQDVMRHCREHHIAGVVIDVEPFVVRWDAPQDEYDAALSSARGRLLPPVRSVLFATNARRPPAGGLRQHARKPWVVSAYARQDRPLAVVGDTILTDGLLAFRLGALFLQCGRPARVPAWPRVQGWFGRLVAPLLFRDAR